MVLSVDGPDEICVSLVVFVFEFVFKTKLNVDLDCCTVQKARAMAELLATKQVVWAKVNL